MIKLDLINLEPRIQYKNQWYKQAWYSRAFDYICAEHTHTHTHPYIHILNIYLKYMAEYTHQCWPNIIIFQIVFQELSLSHSLIFLPPFFLVSLLAPTQYLFHHLIWTVFYNSKLKNFKLTRFGWSCLFLPHLPFTSIHPFIRSIECVLPLPLRSIRNRGNIFFNCK